jgi:nicotinate-nucleotide pyrophosphorylase (carboxylating)
MIPLDVGRLRDILRIALDEDLGSGDVTSLATIPPMARAKARYTTKQPLVVSGLPVIEEVARMVDPKLSFESLTADGDSVKEAVAMAELSGSARSILAAERVTLNLLQRMCGIATQTSLYVQKVAGTKATIIDTRKTVPGLRLLDKYAVACGGGTNHRMGLYDAILIKNNHLAFHSTLPETVKMARENIAGTMKIEVEVSNLMQLEDAIRAGADVVLLDNFSAELTRQAVAQCRGRVPLESSGGITIENVREYAEAGVDRISVGALTHSVQAADIHLRVTPI